MNRKKSAIYYLVLSVIGALMILVLLWFIPSEDRAVSFFDRLIVGGAFVLFCLFGISLALRPNWIRRMRSHGTDNDS